MNGSPQLPCHSFHSPSPTRFMSKRMNCPGGTASENPWRRESAFGPTGFSPSLRTYSVQPWYTHLAVGPSARAMAPYAALARASHTGSGGRSHLHRGLVMRYEDSPSLGGTLRGTAPRRSSTVPACTPVDRVVTPMQSGYVGEVHAACAAATVANEGHMGGTAPRLSAVGPSTEAHPARYVFGSAIDHLHVVLVDSASCSADGATAPHPVPLPKNASICHTWSVPKSAMSSFIQASATRVKRGSRPSIHAVSQSCPSLPRVAPPGPVSCCATARAHGAYPPNAGRCPAIPSSRYRPRICCCSSHCPRMNDRGSGPAIPLP
mmetsp:Transcript_7828/g.23126  ORF Transcript_7828/g.23126 Transcript_7828/m.23126 type:complete len:320 (+) Transcript_7828:1134-2093(+)